MSLSQTWLIQFHFQFWNKFAFQSQTTLKQPWNRKHVCAPPKSSEFLNGSTRGEECSLKWSSTRHKKQPGDICYVLILKRHSSMTKYCLPYISTNLGPHYVTLWWQFTNQIHILLWLLFLLLFPVIFIF